MQQEVVTSWPHSYTKQPGELLEHIGLFLQQPTVKQATELIRITNDCLAKALKIQKERTHSYYKKDLLSSLGGSASGAHALLKVF